MTQPDPALTPEAAELRQAQIDEYGQWVATQPIYVGNALAFDTGHPVPAGHVERFGYDKDELVEPSPQARESRRGKRPPKAEETPQP